MHCSYSIQPLQAQYTVYSIEPQYNTVQATIYILLHLRHLRQALQAGTSYSHSYIPMYLRHVQRVARVGWVAGVVDLGDERVRVQKVGHRHAVLCEGFTGFTAEVRIHRIGLGRTQGLPQRGMHRIRSRGCRQRDAKRGCGSEWDPLDSLDSPCCLSILTCMAVSPRRHS